MSTEKYVSGKNISAARNQLQKSGSGNQEFLSESVILGFSARNADVVYRLTLTVR
jgi:hypothetical protein